MRKLCGDWDRALVAFAVFVGVFCGTAVGVAVWAAPKAWVLVKPILHALTA